MGELCSEMSVLRLECVVVDLPLSVFVRKQKWGDYPSTHARGMELPHCMCQEPKSKPATEHLGETALSRWLLAKLWQLSLSVVLLLLLFWFCLSRLYFSWGFFLSVYCCCRPQFQSLGITSFTIPDINSSLGRFQIYSESNWLLHRGLTAASQ